MHPLQVNNLLNVQWKNPATGYESFKSYATKYELLSTGKRNKQQHLNLHEQNLHAKLVLS